MKKILISVSCVISLLAATPLPAELPLILQCDCDYIGRTEKVHNYLGTNWVAYGTFQVDPYTHLDNPATNLIGIVGEVSLPYTVPAGYTLSLDYLQIEGPAGPQVGMALWLGDMPCENSKCIISCTTPGGSTQLQGMLITIPEGEIVNIRVMNNTTIPWVNGFYLQGQLHPIGGY